MDSSTSNWTVNLTLFGNNNLKSKQNFTISILLRRKNCISLFIQKFVNSVFNHLSLQKPSLEILLSLEN